jgi:tetratricopeptide (TPR) repeat protein
VLSYATVPSQRERSRGRRRLPGIDIRPGSVKAARLEAGLSLAQVAGSQLTRAAIYLVETGRARPSRRTLKLISARTGKPIEFFRISEVNGAGAASRVTELDPRLAEIEAMVASARFKPAIAASRRLLATVGSADSALQARIRLRMGEAQLETGRTADALASLRLARDILAATDQELLAECLDLIGVALKRLEDRDALAAYKEALRLCRQAAPGRKELEARILGHIGAAYTSTHDWQAAIEHYEMALAAAGNIRDIGFLERMYNDIGLVELEADHLTAAFGYFQKALALAEVRHEPAVIARIENNIGSVLVSLGETEPAEAHLARSLEICDSIGLDAGRGHVLCSLAELEVERGRLDPARRHAAEAVAVTERGGETLTQAFAHQLSGRIAELAGDKTSADASFQRAIGLLAGQHAPRRLMECHLAYANVLEARGNFKDALSHSREALMLAQPDLRFHPSGSHVRSADAVTAASA